MEDPIEDARDGLLYFSSGKKWRKRILEEVFRGFYFYKVPALDSKLLYSIICLADVEGIFTTQGVTWILLSKPTDSLKQVDKTTFVELFRARKGEGWVKKLK